MLFMHPRTLRSAVLARRTTCRSKPANVAGGRSSRRSSRVNETYGRTGCAAARPPPRRWWLARPRMQRRPAQTAALSAHLPAAADTALVIAAAVWARPRGDCGVPARLPARRLPGAIATASAAAAARLSALMSPMRRRSLTWSPRSPAGSAQSMCWCSTPPAPRPSRSRPVPTGSSAQPPAAAQPLPAAASLAVPDPAAGDPTPGLDRPQGERPARSPACPRRNSP